MKAAVVGEVQCAAPWAHVSNSIGQRPICEAGSFPHLRYGVGELPAHADEEIGRRWNVVVRQVAPYCLRPSKQRAHPTVIREATRLAPPLTR